MLKIYEKKKRNMIDDIKYKKLVIKAVPSAYTNSFQRFFLYSYSDDLLIIARTNKKIFENFIDFVKKIFRMFKFNINIEKNQTIS